jgi:hypothetical protein
MNNCKKYIVQKSTIRKKIMVKIMLHIFFIIINLDFHRTNYELLNHFIVKSLF